MQVQVGDIASRGPSWARVVTHRRAHGRVRFRPCGVRSQSAIPLAGFEGSAALPSTVEVFSDSIRAYSADVPAGPFSIRDLPLTGGSGVARVVVRDVTGRETLVDLPFLMSDLLLKPGLADFALSVGRPRLGIGTPGDRYGDDIFGVGTLRYGVTDALTLSAHAEGGRGLQMAGAGAVVRIGHLGTASLGLAGSRSDRGSGALLDLSTSLSIGSAALSGRLMRTQGRFDDVAAVSATPRGARTDRYDYPARSPKVSLSMPLDSRIGSGASLFLSDIRAPGPVARETALGLSFSRRLWGDSSVTLSATSTAAERAPDFTTAGSSIARSLWEPGTMPGCSPNAARADGVTMRRSAAKARATSRAAGTGEAQADQGDGRSIRAEAGYENQLGRVEVAARSQSGAQAVGLRVDGAIVASGGGVFLSRPVQDAFAVVDAGAPGSRSAPKIAPSAAGTASGRILVPTCAPYEGNAIPSTRLGCRWMRPPTPRSGSSARPTGRGRRSPLACRPARARR